MSVPAYSEISVQNERSQEDRRALAPRRAGRINDALCRLLDIVLTFAISLFAFPFCLVLALLIKLDSPGPVLFVQSRVGRDGREFPFFKFRSMRADAEQVRDALVEANEATGPLFKIKRDPRITRVGRWMRRYSVDELPQLLNVLRGEMSLVGPRPALPREVATYTPYQRQRLSTIPGLTGLWQVSGRSDLPFDEAIRLDLEYIEGRSVWLNILILFRTIPAVLTGRGAY